MSILALMPGHLININKTKNKPNKLLPICKFTLTNFMFKEQFFLKKKLITMLILTHKGNLVC